MKRTYPLSLADFKQILHPPTSGSVQDDSPELNGSGFFCSGPYLPGSIERIIVRYNLTQCPDLQPPELVIIVRFFCPAAKLPPGFRTIVRFTPSRSRCPVPGSGIGVTIVRGEDNLGSSAAVPGHHSPIRCTCSLKKNERLFALTAAGQKLLYLKKR